MAELTRGAFLPPPVHYRVRPDPVQNRVNTFQSPPDPLLAFIMSTLHFLSFLGSKYYMVFLNTYFQIYIYIISYISSSFHISYHHFIRDVSYHHLLHIFFVIYHIIISYNILAFRISYNHLRHISLSYHTSSFLYYIIISSFQLI